MKKLALLGNTGVGKDTCVKIIKNQFSHLKLSLIQLRRLENALFHEQKAEEIRRLF